MDQYTIIADLFDYPDAKFPATVKRVKDYLDANYPNAGEKLNEFMDFVAESTPEEREELYCRTFEVQGITTLDATYVLFGDDYKRGACLVNLNREHNAVNNDTRGELADHLPAMLRLLPKMENRLLAEELIGHILMPAMDKLVEAFGPEKLKMKNRVYKKHHTLLIETNVKYSLVFAGPLRALNLVMQHDYTKVESIAPKQNEDFLKNINTELVNADK